MVPRSFLEYSILIVGCETVGKTAFIKRVDILFSLSELSQQSLNMRYKLQFNLLLSSLKILSRNAPYSPMVSICPYREQRIIIASVYIISLIDWSEKRYLEEVDFGAT
jgi:hypothetical protein